MSEDRTRIEEVERSIEATRGRMAATAAELDEAVSSRVAAAKDAVDVRRLIAENPWTSLFLALGAGILLARSGADERAADAVRRAPGATKRGASRAAGALRDKLRRRGGSDEAADEVVIDEAVVIAVVDDASGETTRPQEVATRVSKALHGDELLADMRTEADRIGRASFDDPGSEWRRI